MKNNKLKSIIIKVLIGLIILIVFLLLYIKLTENACFKSCNAADIGPCPDGMAFGSVSYRLHWYCLSECGEPTCINRTNANP